MAVIDWLSISGIIVDIILFCIVAGNAVFAYRVGFARIFCRFVSTIAAIILVLILYKPVSNYVMNNTNIPENLKTVLSTKLEQLIIEEGSENVAIEEIKEDSSLYGILKIFIGNELGNVVKDTTNSLISYLSTEITYKIIRIVIFLALFAIIRLVLYVLRNYIEMIASIPIINVFNGIGGMIYGILRGFFIIYIAFAVISIIMPMIGNNIIIESIQKAVIGSKMFNNNILLNLILKK